MTHTTSYNDKNSTTTTLRSEHTACVRYGFPEESDQPRQSPELRQVDAPIPDGAETASPIYLLTQNQYQQHQSFNNPYRVANASCIATAFQNECEADNAVLYPVYIESDTYLEEGPKTLIEWFTRFLGQVGVAPEDCTFYYSGNRSIHVHLPKFVAGDDQRERLKDRVAAFCDDTGAKFDLGLYSRKRQFRLPGVVHEKTRLQKVQIDPAWGHEEIVRTANSSNAAVPATYLDVLGETFSIHPTVGQVGQEVTPKSVEGGATAGVLQRFGGDESLLSLQNEQACLDPPVIERQSAPEDDPEQSRWEAFNRKEFSPYAHAGNGSGRSVASVKVLGGPFQREEVGKDRILVPVYFHGAHGCNGRKFTKHQHHAPLQLSTPDFEKWEYTNGDRVILIGGASRRSRIFEVNPDTATIVGCLLDPDKGSRRKALEYLHDEGYDIGSEGGSGASTKDPVETQQFEQVLPANIPRTEAGELQQRAEQEGIQTLIHEEKGRVACRLLTKYGWKPTWNWFRKQFGDEFKPRVTYRQLRGIVNSYPEDYDHITVPAEPE